MRKCPRCQIKLFATRISDVNVRQCGKCQGNLITLDRLNRLAVTRKRSVPELMKDWRGYPPVDTSGRCRCPQCRWTMEQHTERGGVKFDHYKCRECKLLWLDAGEVELYLLAYLISEKGQEAQRFKDIHQNMSEAEKKRLQAMIDALPDDVAETYPDPFEEFYLGFFRFE